MLQSNVLCTIIHPPLLLSRPDNTKLRASYTAEHSYLNQIAIEHKLDPALWFDLVCHLYVAVEREKLEQMCAEVDSLVLSAEGIVTEYVVKGILHEWAE